MMGTKGTGRFPIDENDWKFFSKTVPTELQAFHEKGFKIVVFRFKMGPPCLAMTCNKRICANACKLAAIRTASKQLWRAKWLKKLRPEQQTC